MKTRKRPDPQGNGESGQNKKQKYFYSRPHHYTKKYDKIILQKIANQNLGLVSKLATRELLRLQGRAA